ncbi:MAG: hypothetical protein EP343_09735 [Deltaproteobacteria bacterium]|nr:MAG: hypothetical protein EP343_09735 [Deltaproteobacteria bacterium]
MPVSRYNGNQPVLPQMDTTPVASPLTEQPTTLQPLRLDNNAFDVGGTQGSNWSPAVREKADSAVNNFDTRLRSILHHDAMSLAEGHTPFRNGDTLTDTQRNDLSDAAKDMLMDLPIGALSPQMTSRLRGVMESQGLSTDNLETKTLDDLGDIGGDLAKEWADDLKDGSPAAYYGLLGAAGAAVGTYGFLQGSEALKDLGIKPEFSTGLFGDHVKVKAEAMWERRFSNPNATVDVQGRYRVGDFALRGGVNVDTRDLDNTHGNVGVRWGDNQTFLDAEARGSVNSGLDTVHLRGRYQGDNYHLHGNAVLNDDMSLRHGRVGAGTTFGDNGNANVNLDFTTNGRPSSVNGNLRYETDNYFVRGEASYDLIEDNHSADLYGGYKPTDDLEIGVRGGYGRDTGARVGVGLTWRF